jgi:hypothetical protein
MERFSRADEGGRARIDAGFAGEASVYRPPVIGRSYRLPTSFLKPNSSGVKSGSMGVCGVSVAVGV